MLSGGLFACVLDSVLGLLMSFQSFHVFPVPKSEQKCGIVNSFFLFFGDGWLSYQVRLACATAAIAPFSLEVQHYECQADEELVKIEQHMEFPGLSMTGLVSVLVR